MNKLLMLGGVIVLVIAAGIFISQSNTEQGQPTDDSMAVQENSEQQADVSDSESFTGSFADLLRLGQTYTCTYAEQTDNGQQQGTVYVANERMRGDFEISSSETGNMEGHVIRDGNWMYVWGDTPLGMFANKYEYDVNAMSGEGETEKNKNFDIDEEFDFDCDSWNVDTSKFNPPANISFQDISTNMQMLQENSEAAESMMGGDTYTETTGEKPQINCSVCDAIPAGEQREQCLSALGC